MKLLNHLYHIEQLPPSSLRNHLTNKYNHLVETKDDLPQLFVVVEEDDDITGPNFAFVSDNGLLGDGDVGSSKYHRPYENVSYISELRLYEALYLANGEDGYWILIPAPVVEAHLDLKWVLTDEGQGGLSDPQPL